MHKELVELFCKPFPAEQISWKVQTARGDEGDAVAYIDARDVQERLDEAVKAGLLVHWEAEYEVVKDESRQVEKTYWEKDESGQRAQKTRTQEERTLEVECTLRLFVSPETLGLESEDLMVFERRDVGEGGSLKGAYSDAFKRAAVQWGIGRFLYSLPTERVRVQRRGYLTVLPDDELERLRALTRQLLMTPEEKTRLAVRSVYARAVKAGREEEARRILAGVDVEKAGLEELQRVGAALKKLLPAA